VYVYVHVDVQHLDTHRFSFRKLRMSWLSTFQPYITHTLTLSPPCAPTTSYSNAGAKSIESMFSTAFGGSKMEGVSRARDEDRDMIIRSKLLGAPPYEHPMRHIRAHAPHTHTCVTYAHMRHIRTHASHTHTCITYAHMRHIRTHASHTHTCVTYAHMRHIRTHASHTHTCVTYAHMRHIRTHASHTRQKVF
jgi:hypothetical protein